MHWAPIHFTYRSTTPVLGHSFLDELSRGKYHYCSMKHSLLLSAQGAQVWEIAYINISSASSIGNCPTSHRLEPAKVIKLTPIMWHHRPPLTRIAARIWAMPNKNGSRWCGMGIQRAVPASAVHHHWISPIKTAGGIGVPHSAGLSLHNSSRQTTGYSLHHCCFPKEAGSKLLFPKTAASMVLSFKLSDGVMLTFSWSAEVKGQPPLFQLEDLIMLGRDEDLPSKASY